MSQSSIITYDGKSTLIVTQDAVDEAMTTWPSDFKADILWVYYAPCHDPKDIADAIQKRCPNIPMLGCSTAGEWLNGAYQQGGLVIMAMASDDITWSITAIDLHQGFHREDAHGVVKKLLNGMPEGESQRLHVDHQFVILLMDGQSYLEEVLVSEMSDALQGVALVGGSAADGLDFESTTVISNGAVFQSGAVFAMAHTTLPFHIMLHQQFQSSDKEAVVTKVSACGRKIYGLDGLPAQDRYRELLAVDKLDETQSELWMEHPLIHQYDNHFIVHAVGGCCDGDGLWLFNAVEEGMILSLGHSECMELSLKRFSRDCSSAEVTWVFNCLWRSELWQREKNRCDGQLDAIQEHTTHMIGFDGYGEQCNGLHHNQTVTFLMLGIHSES